MAILAKRFDFQDKESQVATAGFTGELPSSILNDPGNALLPKSETLDDIIKSESQKTVVVTKETDVLDSVTRASKDLRGKLSDLKNLPKAGIDQVLGEISGGDVQLQRNLGNILSKCSARGMGTGLPGRPFSPSISCGGNSSGVGGRGKGGASCDAFSFMDVLNRLTGGAYGGIYSDVNAGLKSLMALAGYGYNMGMCGMFSAFSGGLPGIAKGRAMGGLMDQLGSAGNITGIFDLAKNATGLAPLLTNPSGLSSFFDNFSLGGRYSEKDFVSLADQSLGAAELFDEGWNSSEYDDLLSFSEANRYSEDLGDVFEAKLYQRSFTEDTLDEIPSGDDDFLVSSYLMAA